MEGLRAWTVAGGLVESAAGVLLVRNRRRGGSEDWSTPGGVIDPTDATVVDGLSREVTEETGLVVREWHGPLYEVRAVAPDLGWVMRCEVHRAGTFEGELTVADPDGIVVAAEFVAPDRCPDRLASCPRWVREPLAAWLAARWTPEARRSFRYEIRGRDLGRLEVVCTGVTTGDDPR